MRLGRDVRGNLAVLTAIVAVPLCGIAGVAVDYMRYLNAETDLHAALDAAVLAGAAARYDHAKKAQSVFRFDGSNSLELVTSISFVKSANVRVTGSLTAKVPTTFARLLGIYDMNIEILAAAEAAPPANKLCIMTLAPSATQEFLVNGGANVKADGCTIQVKSTANPAAVFNAGTSIESRETCIEGTDIIDNGGSHPNTRTGCMTDADPYAGKIPAPGLSACDFSNLNYSGAVTLSPGVYCGWMNFNPGTTVTLKPGTYVIKSGGWNVDGGTWSGAGVTFYYADTSKIQFNHAVAATLSAPTSGTYKDILMAEEPGLANTQFIFNDNLGFDMTGVIYLPSRDVVFNSNSTQRSRNMTAVMHTLILNSTSWDITPYDGGNSGPGPGQTRLLF